ncbi:serine/arginine repetitive matrix protein 1-like isoform X2 [Athalia rosae]|uniref:serine/arginine repetitive matrix protein 1-like isoform X2 n=1 Tax=Athalia rosae TaxID=37344 RepID=UPI0020342C42|nr:serine/arginine repetitive matrix protein 1-like isoform X2 [Athalia rosae]
MHLSNRCVRLEILAIFPSRILHNMDYRQKMVVAPNCTHANDNGEDDDDEDLEALRMAALQSLRAKDSIKTNPQLWTETKVNVQHLAHPRLFNNGQRPLKRQFPQNRLPRQNGTLHFQRHVNPNLIAIVPVEGNLISPLSDPPETLLDTKSPIESRASDESKFCRYKDNARSSDEDDDADRRVLISKKPEIESRVETGKGTDIGVQFSDVDNTSTHDESPQCSDEDEKEEDDDDVLLMADLEEEDSLERLMDEMEREIGVDKTADVRDKKQLKKENKGGRKEEAGKRLRDRAKLESIRANRSSSPTVLSSSIPIGLKTEPRPLSPYNVNRTVYRRRSLSPKPRSRKKSPRRSPRRSPSRQIKKTVRDTGRENLRFRSPRKSPPQYSPKPRSPRLSPRRSPLRRSPGRVSPRISPRSRSPRLSSVRSPRTSPYMHLHPRSRSPRLSPRPRSPKLSPRRSPVRISPRPRSPKLSPRLRSPRLSPRLRSPRPSPRRPSPRCRSPRMSPKLSPRRLSPRNRSPRVSPRRISPRPRSPGLSPRKSPWSSPRHSPRLSPRRRRSPQELFRKNRPRSITPCRHQSPLTKRGQSPIPRVKNTPDDFVRLRIKLKEEPHETISPSDSGKGGDDTSNDPVLEARRKKFESTKPIDPINANKKIKLTKKETRDKKPEVMNESESNIANLRSAYKVIENKYEMTDSYLGSEFVFEENLEERNEDSPAATIASTMNVCSEIEPAKLEREKPVKKKKKKDKELYQVHKSKGELPLSERIGKEKKCKKRKEVASDNPAESKETIFEDLTIDEEDGDLRTELSRRRAERLNRTGPIHQQSVRLVQSAFKGVVTEVVKSNAKSIKKQLVKSDDKQSQKEVRRVTVLHRPVADSHDSEGETTVDSKVPVRFRLGLNKTAQNARESKGLRKNSKRQSRKD